VGGVGEAAATWDDLDFTGRADLLTRTAAGLCPDRMLVWGGGGRCGRGWKREESRVEE